MSKDGPSASGSSGQGSSGPGGLGSSELLAPGDHELRAKVESRARGKKITSIGPFRIAAAEAGSLAKAIKKSCGAGGKWAADGFLEVQGDVALRARAALEKLGFRFHDPAR